MVTSPLPYPITLTGDGLVLREWCAEDLAHLVELLHDPDIARWTPMPSPFDVEAGIAYLKRAHQGRLGGQRIQLAITSDGRRPLGEVLLFNLDAARREAEIGYLVGAPYRRRGLACGSLGLLSGYALSALKLSRLVLRIDPRNTASIAVARRCGYRLTTEPPILQVGPDGPTSLETWAIPDGTLLQRGRNVATRRYGRRT